MTMSMQSPPRPATAATSPVGRSPRVARLFRPVGRWLVAAAAGRVVAVATWWWRVGGVRGAMATPVFQRVAMVAIGVALLSAVFAVAYVEGGGSAVGVLLVAVVGLPVVIGAVVYFARDAVLEHAKSFSRDDPGRGRVR